MGKFAQAARCMHAIRNRLLAGVADELLQMEDDLADFQVTEFVEAAGTRLNFATAILNLLEEAAQEERERKESGGNNRVKIPVKKE